MGVDRKEGEPIARFCVEGSSHDVFTRRKNFELERERESQRCEDEKIEVCW
jgi:hypothetical protein